MLVYLRPRYLRVREKAKKTKEQNIAAGNSGSADGNQQQGQVSSSLSFLQKMSQVVRDGDLDDDEVDFDDEEADNGVEGNNSSDNDKQDDFEDKNDGISSEEEEMGRKSDAGSGLEDNCPTPVFGNKIGANQAMR